MQHRQHLLEGKVCDLYTKQWREISLSFRHPFKSLFFNVKLLNERKASGERELVMGPVARYGRSVLRISRAMQNEDRQAVRHEPYALARPSVGSGCAFSVPLPPRTQCVFLIGLFHPAAIVFIFVTNWPEKKIQQLVNQSQRYKAEDF